MAHPPRPHLREPDGKVVVAGVVELHVAGEVLGPDREERRPHQLGEHVGEGTFGLTRAVDVERCLRVVQRREERQTLDVVPVQMAQQHGAVEGLVSADGLAVRAQSRAEVEHDRRLAGRFDGHARGMPAVARVLRTFTWGRTPNAVECHAYAPEHGR